MRLLPLACLLALFASPALAQDGPDAAKQIEKYERYLDRKPYHEWAFGQMVEAAVRSNALGSLVERYERRADGGGTTAEKVVLARLLAHVDRVPEALERLEAIEEPPAELLRLVGELKLRAGDPAAATVALDAAAQATDNPRELEALHRLRGEARLAEGDDEGAIAAFRDLANLDPDDLNLRLEASDALARHGLAEAALEELREAERLAADDPMRRCRVLAEIGRLHEQLADGESALAVYDEAIALMARGNWLKRDLRERVVALHRRTDALEALVLRAARAAEADPQDLDAQEFHARALTEAERPEEALAVLEKSVQAFPSDLALARTRIELLRETGDTLGVVAEYQRILGERPNELDLYLELGQAFAEGGQLEQARLQWQKTLDERLDDPGLASRLAGLYARYEQPDDAIALYEKAISLESGEVSRYADLATYLRAIGRAEEVTGVLERAEATSVSSPSQLDEVAVLWREFGAPERARRALEAALALAPDEVRLLRRFADAQLEAGELEPATETLHRVVALAPDAGTRRTAVDRLVRAWWSAGREEELVARERTAFESGGPATHALVLGKLHVRRRAPREALDVYASLVESAPELEEAREATAKLLEEAGDLDGALAQYAALIEARPQNRRKYLKNIAELHLERYDQEAAFACYDEILSTSPDNPAAFREVAKAYDKLGLLDESIECYQQALRLDPDDGRTRLELAELFRATGEWDRAERQVIDAFEARDESTVKKARERYHAILAEDGRLEDEVRALRERVKQNPYDLAAPVTLTDLYVRELEFELALEMLDDLLRYQPNAAALLSERARILMELERYDDAIVVYEDLLRLPGADRSALEVEIADAEIRAGRRDRAEAAMARAGDPEGLARLYQKNDLPELALGVLEEAYARRPGDVRLLSRLARLRESVRDREGAIEAVESMIALRGESWRTLKRLGLLQHEAGKDDDALGTGRRLFALIRIEDAPEPADEEDDDAPGRSTRRRSAWGSASRGWSSASTFDRRIDELRNWYGEIDSEDEFLVVAQEELRRQPTNDKLLATLVGQLNRKEERGAEITELVGLVRAATLDGAEPRIPAGLTEDQWRRRLDGYLGNVASKDTLFARGRVEELGARLEDGSATATEVRERADHQFDLGDKEAAIATLNRGVELHPEDPHVRAGLATLLDGERRFEEAVVHWQQLVANLEASGAPIDSPAERVELSYRQSRTRTLRGFPIHVQRRISEEELRRHWELTRSRSWWTGWTLGSDDVSPVGARASLARSLHGAGRTDDAVREVQALEALIGAAEAPNEDPTSIRVTDLQQIAGLWSSLERDEVILASYERMRGLEEALGAHPVHGFSRTWSSSLRRSRRDVVKVYEERGEHVAAYDLLRDLNALDEGKLLLEEHELHDALVAFYEERAADSEGTEWRNAMVKLAEIHQHARRWDDCLATYRAIEARDAEDFAARTAVATILERTGDLDGAIASHESIVEAKRAANRRSERPSVPPAEQLAPIEVPRAESDSNYVWQNLRNAGRWGSRTPGKQSVTENYGAMLKLLLDQRRVEEATEVMRRIAREDASNMSWLGHTLANVVEQYRLGAEGVPILRLIHLYDSSEYLSIRYGQALMAAKRWEEARRVYRDIIDSSSTQQYYRQEAEQQLELAEKRLGLDSEVTLADLEAQVESDPKNAKARIALARRILGDADELPREAQRREAEAAALEHALAAEEVAPHLDEVRNLVTQLLQLTGDNAELERRVLESLDDIEDDDQVVSEAVRLADWMVERGADMSEVDALFERARKQVGGYFRYSTPAVWYYKRGDIDRAIAVVRECVERGDSWRREDLEAGLAVLQERVGDPASGLDGGWKAFEKASARGDKGAALDGIFGPVRSLSTRPEALARVEDVASGREGLRRELELAAVDLARGDAPAAEARLTESARADRAHAFLYPTLVDLARARGDLAAALAHLEELAELNLVSESSRVNSKIGNLAEADLLRAEIGALRHELGDTAGAQRIWDEMFDESETHRFRVMASLYSELELHERAIEAQQKHIEENGGRNRTDLERLATLYEAAGNVDEAIAALERVLLIVDDDDWEHGEMYARLLGLYRAAGRLDERREELRERYAQDPTDVMAALELARLEAEGGDEARAQELLEAVAERPDQLERIAPILIRAARERGDLAVAMSWYEKLLAGNADEWERRNHAAEYAKLLMQSGETSTAVAAIRDSYPDPEGEEALGAAISALTEERKFEEALELVAELEELSSDADEHLPARANLLRSLERGSEALELLRAAVADPARRNDALVSGYVASARSNGSLDEERQLIEGGLADDPDDEGLLWRWLALYESGGQVGAEAVHERAVEACTELLGLDPGNPNLLASLSTALAKVGRETEALPYIDEALEILDRRRTENDWAVRNRVSTLRRERARALLVAEGPDAAIRAQQDRKGRRYERLQQWDLRIDSLSNTRGGENKLDSMSILGLDDAYLEAAEDAVLNDGQRVRVLDIRYRRGERDAVVEELWNTAFRTPPIQVGEVAQFERSPWEARRAPTEYQLPYEDPARKLVDYLREEERLDEAVARMEELLAEAQAADATLSEVVKRLEAALRLARGYLAKDRKPGEPLPDGYEVPDARAQQVEAARKAIEERPYDAAAMVALARLQIQGGGGEEALELLLRAEPLLRGKAYAALEEYEYASSTRGPSSLRFRFATANNSYSSGSSRWGTSRDQQFAEHQRLLAAAYFAAGRRDDGLEYEARVDRMGTATNGGWVYDPFTGTWTQGSATLSLYASLGLWSEVERVAEVELAKIAEEEADDPEALSRRTNRILDQLITAYAGDDLRPRDEVRWSAAIERRRAAWDAFVEERPDDIGRRVGRVEWLRATAKNEEAWRQEMETLVADPRWREQQPAKSRAWALAALGDFEGAKSAFDEGVAKRSPYRSVVVFDDVDAGLALCRHHAGDVAGARADLMRAWVRLPARVEIREALGFVDPDAPMSDSGEE